MSSCPAQGFAPPAPLRVEGPARSVLAPNQASSKKRQHGAIAEKFRAITKKNFLQVFLKKTQRNSEIQLNGPVNGIVVRSDGRRWTQEKVCFRKVWRRAKPVDGMTVPYTGHSGP